MESVLNRLREQLVANSLFNTNDLIGQYTERGSSLLDIYTFNVGSIFQVPNGDFELGNMDAVMFNGNRNIGYKPVWDQLVANRAAFPAIYRDMVFMVGNYSTSSNSTLAQSQLEIYSTDLGNIPPSNTFLGKIDRQGTRTLDFAKPGEALVFNRIATTNNYLNFNGYLCILKNNI
jgi:hypothetical protein